MLISEIRTLQTLASTTDIVKRNPTVLRPQRTLEHSRANSAGELSVLETTLAHIHDFAYAFDREGRFVYGQPGEG